MITYVPASHGDSSYRSNYFCVLLCRSLNKLFVEIFSNTKQLELSEGRRHTEGEGIQALASRNVES